MKRSKGGRRAMMFETLVATDNQCGRYYTCAFYGIDGERGIYRRIPANDASKYTQAIEAYWDDGGDQGGTTIMLVPAQDAMKEILEVGFTFLDKQTLVDKPLEQPTLFHETCDESVTFPEACRAAVEQVAANISAVMKDVPATAKAMFSDVGKAIEKTQPETVGLAPGQSGTPAELATVPHHVKPSGQVMILNSETGKMEPWKYQPKPPASDVKPDAAALLVQEESPLEQAKTEAAKKILSGLSTSCPILDCKPTEVPHYANDFARAATGQPPATPAAPVPAKPPRKGRKKKAPPEPTPTPKEGIDLPEGDWEPQDGQLFPGMEAPKPDLMREERF